MAARNDVSSLSSSSRTPRTLEIARDWLQSRRHQTTVALVLYAALVIGVVARRVRRAGAEAGIDRQLPDVSAVTGPQSLTEVERRRIELRWPCATRTRSRRCAHAGEVIVRDGERLQVMHNGVVVSEGRYHGAWMTEVIRRLRGHHEPQEELAFHTVLERLATSSQSPIMLELGSFWAYYSIWAKHRIPSARLVLLEPDPSNLAVGRHNLELNGMDATFVQAAIGSEHDSAGDPDLGERQTSRI